MSTFDTWLARNNGAWRDLDGAYGAQCWDLFAAYCVEVLGAPLSQTHTAASGLYKGFAGSLYVSFPTSAWQGQAFERIPAGSAAKKGDVAIWDKEPAHPDTHVAIVTQDAPAGARITVIAQNVGHTQDARIMSETPASLGYLRPKNQQPITGETNTTTEEDQMKCILQLNDEGGLNYFDGQKLHPLSDPDQVTVLNIIAKQTLGHDLPCFKLGSNAAPWGTRLREAIR